MGSQAARECYSTLNFIRPLNDYILWKQSYVMQLVLIILFNLYFLEIFLKIANILDVGENNFGLNFKAALF